MPPAFFHSHGTFHGLVDLRHSALGVRLLSWALFGKGSLSEWGNYFRRAKIRKLFHQLDGWIERRIWSHRFKRWRNRGWKELPTRKLCGELGLIRLTHLIPSLERLKWAYSS
ncbi:MAG: group II intron maturase-specific domain-containing protein [Vulcanimicrobiota bacterium]